MVAAGPLPDRGSTSIRVPEVEPQKLAKSTYPLLDLLEKAGIRVTRLKYLQREIRPIRDLRACFELHRLIKNFKPDVLFLCSSKAGFLGSLVSHCTLYPIPCTLIYRIGGWSFNDPWPNWKKKLWIFIEKLSAPWKDIIIVNNQHDLDQAKHLRIKPRQSLELIHNGLDINSLNFLSRENAHHQLNLPVRGSTSNTLSPTPYPLHPTLVGTIANFYPTKGLIYLIEAFKIFCTLPASHSFSEGGYPAPCTLVIIGDGEERPKLEAKIADLGLKNQVFLVGQKNEAYRYLKAFDIYIQPSIKEGFPWALLEAMAAGLPVVATRVGAIPEIIQDGQNGLIVPPRNPESLASAVASLLSNESLRHTLGTAASQTVVNKFSLSKMVQKIERLLA